MNSFAIWTSPKFKKNSLEVAKDLEVTTRELSKEKALIPGNLLDLHFNLWCAYNPNKNFKKQNSILDIGIMIYDIRCIDELNIYFPFSVKQSDIKDLGSRLRDNTTLNAVFNDNHRIKETSDSKAFLVANADGGTEGASECEFMVYSLDSIRDLKLQHDLYDSSSDMTLMTINISNLYDLKKYKCNQCYFRFRVVTSDLQEVMIHSRVRSKIDAFFQDALSVTQIVEFRLNHSRSLPRSLRETVGDSGGFPPLKKLHFFLLTDETVSLENDAGTTIRRLEKSVWNNYVPKSESGTDTENIIAYHWKRKASNDDYFFEWDLYAKIKLLYRNWSTLAAYLLMAVILGAVGGIVAQAAGSLFAG